MKKTFVLVLASAFVFVIISACSLWTDAGKPDLVRGKELIMVATVVKVDLDTRIVTLKDAEGDVLDFAVPREAVNLPQVKPGDIVTVKYLEAVAVEVIKPGKSAAAGERTTISRSKPGEMPGGVITHEKAVTATVKAIDKQSGTISLAGTSGKTVKVKVHDPANLDLVKVGDELLINYIEARAISVQRPEKAPEKK